MTADCPHAGRMTELLGDQLAADARDRLEAHVADCGACQQALLRLAGTLTLPASLPAGGEPHPELLQRLKELGRSLPGTSAGTRDARLQPGQRPSLPRFEILEEVGRGGAGVVYRARQDWLDRIVAIKVVYPERIASEEMFERARRGLVALAACAHPNIVTVFEIGRHEGLCYGVLEYLDGGSLADHLTGQPWRPRTAAHLVQQLAEALAEIHARGIVHRDLKPANILLKRQAGRGTGHAPPPPGAAFVDPSSTLLPKIADFGLARPIGGSTLTEEGAILGTLVAMAPEQAAGRSDLGPATDIYALGEILYELLTGRPPFRAATHWQQLQQIMHEPPPPPAQLAPGTPPDLEWICLKCLSKSPQQRYATAWQLADDLAAWRAGRPLPSRPLARGARIGRLLWPWRRSAAPNDDA